MGDRPDDFLHRLNRTEDVRSPRNESIFGGLKAWRLAGEKEGEAGVLEAAMQSKLLHEASGQRTFAVVLATGDEVLSSLQQFVQRENIHAATFTAIGALSDAVSATTSTGRRKSTRKSRSANRSRSPR